MAADPSPATRPTVVSARTKGFAVAPGPGIDLAGLTGRHILGDDFSLPVLVAHEAALHHNAAVYQQWCARHGVDLAPHAKTSLSPEVTALQMRYGAWGFTVATVHQAAVLLSFGARRLLLASQLVDPSGIRWIARAVLDDPEIDFACWVDSVAGVELLDRVLGEAAAARPLRVLLEIGHDGGRTGVRTVPQALQVAEAVRRSDRLALVGVSGFEGMVPGSGDGPPPGVRPLLRAIREVEGLLHGAGLFDTDTPIVTAGGSSYPDVVVDELGPGRFGHPVRTVLRSGCAVTHDHGLYQHSSPFSTGRDPGPELRPALEVLVRVLSRPEPGLAILGCGRRDLPTDAGFPVVLGGLSETGEHRAAAGRPYAVNDQHLYAEVDADAVIEPGDIWRLGISHPCGAFDRWRVIPLVDEDYRVTGALTTYF